MSAVDVEQGRHKNRDRNSAAEQCETMRNNVQAKQDLQRLRYGAMLWMEVDLVLFVPLYQFLNHINST